MTERKVADLVQRAPRSLRTADTVETGVRRLIETRLPALPVVDARDRYAGTFGEREFMSALFPGYLDTLRGAAFLRRSLDETLEKRDGCRDDPIERYMNTEHVDVGADFSDTQVAEIFLHHRVLVVPVVDDGRVTGLITRGEFFRTVAEQFLGAG